MARPKKYNPTEEQRESVCVMKAGGMTNLKIARVIGCSPESLESYYREELDHGKEIIDSKVMGSLYRMAASGEYPAATFFYLKTRCGWKETSVTEHAGSLNLYSDAKSALLSRIAEIDATAEAGADHQLAEPETGG